jgi:hypothetical protein
MNVQTLPRTLINTYLSVARLPLHAVAKASGQQDNQQWPPALAFEGFEATVESVLGSLLRDDQLLESGRVRQAKVAQLRKAAQLEAVAGSERELARQQFNESRESAQAKRQAAQQRADERARELQGEAQQREAQAERTAAKQAAGVRKAKAAVDQVIDRQERAATTQALNKEAEALKKQRDALDAAETVAVIDETIEGSKEARNTG